MTASLLTPVFNTGGENCLKFSFMFSGNSNITLSVFGKEDSEVQKASKRLLWRFTSHYPAKDLWKSTEVTLPAQYKQLRFESLSEEGGIVGLGLDNISLSIGQCSGRHLSTCYRLQLYIYIHLFYCVVFYPSYMYMLKLLFLLLVKLLVLR